MEHMELYAPTLQKCKLSDSNCQRNICTIAPPTSSNINEYATQFMRPQTMECNIKQRSLCDAWVLFNSIIFSYRKLI